jgi:hypothetical protein
MATLSLAGLDYRSQGNLIYQCITKKIMPPIQWWTLQNLFSLIESQIHPGGDTTFLDQNSLYFGITLPPGGYVIQVKAKGKGLADPFSNSPDQWTIIMRPLWYDTLWFDILVWALIAYVVWRILRTRAYYGKLNVVVSDLQLQALQSQINPHFVGNSINAIHQFFYPPDPIGASNYIELFTQLLRQTIVLSEQHFNAFEEELAYDRDYLQMIKLRFGGRFNYQILGAEGIPPATPFPSMLLQPLLENATIHGLDPGGNSLLELRFSMTGQRLDCTITDNGIGYKAVQARLALKPDKHKSKGLELLMKKVETFNQLYGLGLEMKLSDLSGSAPSLSGTRVQVTFYPVRMKKEVRSNGFRSFSRIISQKLTQHEKNQSPVD